MYRLSDLPVRIAEGHSFADQAIDFFYAEGIVVVVASESIAFDPLLRGLDGLHGIVEELVVEAFEFAFFENEAQLFAAASTTRMHSARDLASTRSARIYVRQR